MNNKTKHCVTLSLFLLSFFLYSFAFAQENLTENLKTGAKFFKTGNYEKALPYFEKVVKQDHKNADAYYKLGRNQEALEAFKQAIRLKPDLAGAHLGLGVVYILLGDKDSALEEYKFLKDLDKEMANELFNLIYK